MFFLNRVNDRNLFFERDYMPVLQQVVKEKSAQPLVPASKRFEDKGVPRPKAIPLCAWIFSIAFS